jgi:ornithine carbamoyltransferase
MQHFLTLKEVSADVVNHIIDQSIQVKGDPEPWDDAMRGKTLAMIFQKTSTRTRFSFEVGMTQLGGHAIFADVSTTQLKVGADLADEARAISRYCDLIMARLKRHVDLRDMARGSEVPVINGLCEKYHPCQALADLMTVKEKFGRTEGVHIVYMGIANNVSNSLALASITTGARFTLCVPEWDPPAVDEELIGMLKASDLYDENPDPQDAIQDADVVYTDTWVNMEYINDPAFAEEKARREKTFLPYQVNEKLIAGRDTLVMHCLPAHKGYEVSETVLDTPNSVVFDQAENRLHAQKGLMLWLMGKV